MKSEHFPGRSMSAPTRRNDTDRAVWYRRGRVPRPPEFGNLHGVGRETRPLRGVVIVAGPPGGRPLRDDGHGGIRSPTHIDRSIP